MKRILFVCLGNICRSPLAEGIAAYHIAQQELDILVDSAGTSSWHQGEPPCANSIKVAHTHGIDISSQVSRPVTDEDKNTFDCIVALDQQNLSDLESKGFQNVFHPKSQDNFSFSIIPSPLCYFL